MKYKSYLSCLSITFVALVVSLSSTQASNSDEHVGKGAPLVKSKVDEFSPAEITDAEVEKNESHNPSLIRSPKYKLSKEDDKNIEIEEISDPEESKVSNQTQSTITQPASESESESEDESKQSPEDNSFGITQVNDPQTGDSSNSKTNKPKKTKFGKGFFSCFG